MPKQNIQSSEWLITAQYMGDDVLETHDTLSHGQVQRAKTSLGPAIHEELEVP